METFELTAIELAFQGKAVQLSFQDAVLVIVTEYGDRLWYIDINGVHNEGLLEEFGQMEDIRVEVKATSAKTAQTFTGIGYFHPNKPNEAAAIRGDGELALK